MSRILSKTILAPQIHQFVVAAPRIAASALPGQFVVVMADEAAERIPLTIADFDRQASTITMVLMVVFPRRTSGARTVCARHGLDPKFAA